ncbi:AL1 [Symbiodinium sp. CCMP2592]|nr:AL1 [Symbiodinium sp. CCMP2592]
MYTDLISFAKLRVPQMSPRSLAMLLRGMARAKSSNRQVLRSAVKVLSAKLVELDVVDACALFVGCAEMNYRDGRFLRLLAAVVKSRLGEASGSQLATAFASYAHMRVRDLPFFDALLFELLRRQHELTEKDASNVAYAMLLLAAVERHELQEAPLEGTYGYPFDTHHGVLYSMLAISNEHRNELNYPAVYQLQIVELYLRLLEPGVYDATRQELKTLLAKARKVNIVVDDYMQNSSRLHRRISQWFTRVGLHHRSEVFLGPFMLDMVIGSRVVVEIDGPSHFYRDTNTRTASSLLKHNLLKAMGFHVRHLPYQEWQQCGTAVKRTMYCSAFWKDVLAANEDEVKAEAPHRGSLADPRVPELVDILDLVLNWQSGQGPHPSIALLGKKLEPKRPQQSLPAFYETQLPEIDDVAASRSKFDVDAERQQARSEQELLAAHAEAEAALEDDRQQSISSIQRVRLDSRKKLEEGHETNTKQDMHDIMPRSRRKVIRHSSSGLFDQDALEANTDDSSDEEPDDAGGQVAKCAAGLFRSTRTHHVPKHSGSCPC